MDGEGCYVHETPFDVALSPIQDATGWGAAPEGAKEFTLVLGNALIRRPSLILKNEQGVYDTVAVYKSKKATEPLYVLPLDDLCTPILLMKA